MCSCVCVQLREHICVGLCQEMAELSGRRCLLHSLAVGVSIMRLTEGCLCVGECISALCECICTVCVCAEWVSLLEMHNNIFGLPVFHGDKGWLLKLQSNGSERCPKAAEHTGTQICTHTHRALTQQTVAYVVTVYLMNWVLCVRFCIVQSFRQGEGEANCLPRNVCL